MRDPVSRAHDPLDRRSCSAGGRLPRAGRRPGGRRSRRGAEQARRYESDPSLSPEDVVRAYVQALDSHDGKRFCELVAPYISGRFDLYLRDPDSEVRAKDCAEFVSAFIGYVEDCGTAREFKGVKLTSVDGVEEHGELRLVHAQVELAQKGPARPATGF